MFLLLCVLLSLFYSFFFKHETAYEMRISDWSSDVCSSDLDIEDRIRGMLPDERRALRQEHARPVLEEMKVWIEVTLSTLPQKQKLAEAMRYALSRWVALSVYIDDGRVEIDNNIAERAMRPLGLGRKNWLFAGSDKGGDRIANIMTNIETVKLHGPI